MTAKFEQHTHNRPLIMLRPEDENERLLLAAFMRFDSNMFRASVTRFENGQIDYIFMIAEGEHER